MLITYIMYKCKYTLVLNIKISNWESIKFLNKNFFKSLGICELVLIADKLNLFLVGWIW